jgi:Zn-finger nucleic acid-binding protein
MNCPACGKSMREMKAGEIVVDACVGGCGGIWFDWFELAKVDEPEEYPGEELLELKRDPSSHVDHDARHNCPRCDDVVMMRHFFSVKRQVQVDECPSCAGFWLDAGELSGIRSLFPSEEAAREAARDVFQELMDINFAEQRRETKEKREKARRIAHMFRFICPSYYIPGKQEWGAF